MQTFKVLCHDDGVTKIFYNHYLQRFEGVVLFDDDVGSVIVLDEGAFWDLVASIFLVE